jgi:hypothetical protein
MFSEVITLDPCLALFPQYDRRFMVVVRAGEEGEAGRAKVWPLVNITIQFSPWKGTHSEVF